MERSDCIGAIYKIRPNGRVSKTTTTTPSAGMANSSPRRVDRGDSPSTRPRCHTFVHTNQKPTVGAAADHRGERLSHDIPAEAYAKASQDAVAYIQETRRRCYREETRFELFGLDSDSHFDNYCRQTKPHFDSHCSGSQRKFRRRLQRRKHNRRESVSNYRRACPPKQIHDHGMDG